MSIPSEQPDPATPITDAVILMAGSGSRLRGGDETFLKPLVAVRGRPLITYTLNALAGAGIKRITAVVGYQGERLRAAIAPLTPAELTVRFVTNHEWQKQNGISLLAAADYMTAPFLLTMADHLFEDAIVMELIKSADPGHLNVAVDRKIDSIFDLRDAMKVRTNGRQLIEIGKNLQTYDAIDTGLFVCPIEIFRYLERAKQNGDCSLADGVRMMALEEKVRAVDIGRARWQDVDTPEMLLQAEQFWHVDPIRTAAKV